MEYLDNKELASKLAEKCRESSEQCPLEGKGKCVFNAIKDNTIYCYCNCISTEDWYKLLETIDAIKGSNNAKN